MIGYAENIILEICSKLQLQPSLYELADERYHTIADTIQDDKAFTQLELRMYPQGSFRLKTTVKPLKGNEYDLDFVVELPKNSNMTPRQLYDHIYRILSTDGTHNNMLEKKSRCIRVCYANDFHIDIMPGQAIERSTNEIIVPDRELKNWYHHSNPIGYSEWFENQARTKIEYILKSQRIQCSAEPIEEQEIASHLEPLRRAVQLIKRYRDIYCDKNNTEPVRSIVLCTLMGYTSTEFTNEMSIMMDFCRYVNGKIATSNGEPFEVRNPVVDEVLTEKWVEDKQNYKDFVNMMKALTDDLDRLNKDVTNASAIKQLQIMFGETITNDAVKKNAERLNKARLAGTVTVGATGMLNATKAVASVKKNTFYGE
jgi:hypothetical protein